jgi:hypothetical protein
MAIERKKKIERFGIVRYSFSDIRYLLVNAGERAFTRLSI